MSPELYGELGLKAMLDLENSGNEIGPYWHCQLPVWIERFRARPAQSGTTTSMPYFSCSYLRPGRDTRPHLLLTCYYLNATSSLSWCHGTFLAELCIVRPPFKQPIT